MHPREKIARVKMPTMLKAAPVLKDRGSYLNTTWLAPLTGIAGNMPR
jgi:hypothetical protein